MLMKYLETKEQPGVIIYLINKLFDTSTENLDLYLPQICYLALTKESEECGRMLEKFILEISMENPNIGFRALHHFQAWSEDAGASYADQAMDLYNQLEGTLVNQNLPKHYQGRHYGGAYNQVVSGGNDLNLAVYKDKLYKADYIGLQIHYMNELKNLSLNLKDPRVTKEKNNFLYRELKRLNAWIETCVRSEATKIHTVETKAKYCGGIVFPFKFGDDQNPYVILNALPELGQVFETKSRAPFKIVFEVCKLSELIEEVE